MMGFEQAMRASGLIPGVVIADGKWRRCYERLIAKRLADPVPPDLYSERHHILPKALGGSDKSANLVRLTAREDAHPRLFSAYADAVRSGAFPDDAHSY